MPKLFFSLLFVFLLLVGCTNHKEDLQGKIQKITNLQKKAKFPVNDASFSYLKSADSIIKNSQNLPDSILIETIFSKGYIFRVKGNLDSAKVYLSEAIGKINNTNARKRDLTYYRHSWETDLVLESYGDVVSSANKFIRLLKSENYNDLIFPYNVLERVNLKLKNYEKALLYNDSVQQVATASNYKEMSLITSFSRARILNTIEQSAQAFTLLDSVSATLNGDDVQRQFYRDYGILHYENGNFPQAIKNYEKSIFYLKKIPDSMMEGRTKELLEAYLNIADGHIQAKNFDSAKKYMDSAKAYIDNNTSFDNLSYVGEIQLKLNVLNSESIGNILDGYYALVNKQNRIHEQKIEDELDALTLANQKEKQLINENKQQEIDNLKLQIGFFVALILIVFVVLIGLLFYRQRKLRFERNSLLLQQRLLRSQMNPHFTFNALYSIKNQIATDQKTATDYLLKFSRLLRLILENSVQNFVELQSELELLEKYLALQLFRFPNTFTYDIQLKNIDEEDLLFIPPMLLQPFIENSIEHGFQNIDYTGHIAICLEKKDELLFCSIEDNGIGWEAKQPSKKSSSLTLISDFILKTTKKPVKIIHLSEIDGTKTGLRVELYVPIKFTEND